MKTLLVGLIALFAAESYAGVCKLKVLSDSRSKTFTLGRNVHYSTSNFPKIVKIEIETNLESCISKAKKMAHERKFIRETRSGNEVLVEEYGSVRMKFMDGDVVEKMRFKTRK